MIDLPWQKFQSPEFGTKFQRGVPLFFEETEVPLYNTVYNRSKVAAPMPRKPSSIRSAILTALLLVTVTDGWTEGYGLQTQGHDTSIASSGKTVHPARFRLRNDLRMKGCIQLSFLIRMAFHEGCFPAIRATGL